MCALFAFAFRSNPSTFMYSCWVVANHFVISLWAFVYLDVFHWLPAKGFATATQHYSVCFLHRFKCSSRFILICYSWAVNTWEQRYRSPPACCCCVTIDFVSRFSYFLFFSFSLTRKSTSTHSTSYAITLKYTSWLI